jgi:predicted transcriptional regulator
MTGRGKIKKRIKARRKSIKVTKKGKKFKQK